MSHENKWDKIKKESEQHQEDEALDSVSQDAEIDETEHASAKKSHHKSSKSSEGHELAHPDYEELEEKLTLSEQKSHENWEKVVRITAEMDNVRRRAEKDIEQARRFGLEKFVSSLLPVLDSLEQAVALVDETTNPAMFEGLNLTMKLFLDALEKQDVHQIDPQGEPFNPQEHEVMSMMDSAELPPNAILNVFQKGYRLSTRVVRPARVIIVKP